MEPNQITGKVEQYYSGKIQEFGPTPRGVDWNSEESQYLRFQQLMKIIPENHTSDFSLLDYGCGFGSLLNYARPIYPSINYTGYDLSLPMLEEGRKRFKPDEATFCNSIPDSSLFDFTIASGIFNVRMEIPDLEWKNYILTTLEKINSLSKYGFSFNLLTSYSDAEYKKDYLYYADPSFLFDYCKKHFSPRIALLHDYPLYEFTLIVRKTL